jgi:hypothetical protein
MAVAPLRRSKRRLQAEPVSSGQNYARSPARHHVCGLPVFSMDAAELEFFSSVEAVAEHGAWLVQLEPALQDTMCDLLGASRFLFPGRQEAEAKRLVEYRRGDAVHPRVPAAKAVGQIASTLCLPALKALGALDGRGDILPLPGFGPVGGFERLLSEGDLPDSPQPGVSPLSFLSYGSGAEVRKKAAPPVSADALCPPWCSLSSGRGAHGPRPPDGCVFACAGAAGSVQENWQLDSSPCRARHGPRPYWRDAAARFRQLAHVLSPPSGCLRLSAAIHRSAAARESEG